MKVLTSSLKQFLILLFISVIISLLDFKNLLVLPKASLQYLSSPIQYGLYKSSLIVTRQLDFIINARTAAKEKLALREQLAQILSENANLRRQLSETQAYLDQSKALDPQIYTYLPARPIGLSRYLKIDKGSEIGIKPGQAVVYKDNLLGEVIRVTPNQAEVLLISDPDSRIAAFSSNENGKAKGVLSGEFGSQMLLDKILHAELIAPKDLVYSEGTEGKFPRGLILGQVTSIDEKPNEVFKQAKVQPVFDLRDLDLIFVLTQ